MQWLSGKKNSQESVKLLELRGRKGCLFCFLLTLWYPFPLKFSQVSSKGGGQVKLLNFFCLDKATEEKFYAEWSEDGWELKKYWPHSIWHPDQYVLLLSIKESWNLREARVLRYHLCLHFPSIIHKIRRKSILLNFESSRELQLVKEHRKTNPWEQIYFLKNWLNSESLQMEQYSRFLLLRKMLIASSKALITIYFLSFSSGLYQREERPQKCWDSSEFPVSCDHWSWQEAASLHTIKLTELGHLDRRTSDKIE